MNLDEHTIQLLPDFLANQIAAGEVVQRPESIVKELIENSLDAGANCITVLIKKAGKHMIHIVDNGLGMSKTDLEMSIKRHATSKIRTSEDLEKIQTLGFRGEALASIAAISHIEIRTKRDIDSHGWKLDSEPLSIPSISPSQQEKGTQIIVKNLFYNVPARRKFLKSDIVEFRYISETMIRFALAKPDIRFIFYDGDNLVFDVHPSTLLERIKDLFGEQTSSGLLPIDSFTEEIKLSGFIGLPHLAKQSRAGQHFFLNGRAIISRSLNHAVFQAYEHLIEKQLHPFFVLNIHVDPSKVDVNVHPQKHEVKFEYEKGIYNCIQQAVQNALAKAHIVPELQFRSDIQQAPFERMHISPVQSQSTFSSQDSFLVNRLTGEIVDNNPRTQYSSPSFQYSKTRDSHSFTPQAKTAYDQLFGSDHIQDNAKHQHSQHRILPGSMWQLHNKYICIEHEHGLMMIDQHAAHERILYESALQSLQDESGKSQTLLFPITVHVLPQDLLLFHELKESLEILGFVFSDEHNNSIIVSALPNDIKVGTEEHALLDIIEQYREYDSIKPHSMRHNLAASMGCKAAIKAGQSLNQQEMNQLIKDLFMCSMPYVCPHGRPIVLEIPLAELDRRFGRT
jgi:DNA mismatch repair protein MutL